MRVDMALEYTRCITRALKPALTPAGGDGRGRRGDELVTLARPSPAARPMLWSSLVVGDHRPSVRLTLSLLSFLSTEERSALIQRLALLKPTCLSAPFERAFHAQASLAPPAEGEQPVLGELMQIHYREDEAIYVQASHDRVTVVFSTMFKEETDRVFGRVFLQVRLDSSFSIPPSSSRTDAAPLSRRALL